MNNNFKGMYDTSKTSFITDRIDDTRTKVNEIFKAAERSTKPTIEMSSKMMYLLKEHISYLEDENKELVYKNIILNEDRRLMSEQLNDIKEYVNFLAIGTQGIKEELIDKCVMGMVKFNQTIWGEEILEIIERNNSNE